MDRVHRNLIATGRRRLAVGRTMTWSVRQRLGLWFRLFSPLEARLVAAARTALAGPAQAVYDQQVSAINRVQRDPSWTELRFYRMRMGKPDWGGVRAFPSAGEFRLAQVRFSVQARSYRATLACIHGHIFDFALSPSPKQIAFESWDGPPAVRLLTDPMRGGSGSRLLEAVAPAWQACLERHVPPPAAGWTLYDRETAYRVPSAGGEYLLLAERGGEEFILQGLEEDGAGDRLFHLRAPDGAPEPIRGAPEEALPQILRSPRRS